MWDINLYAMQSNCKVKQVIILASSFGDIVYLFYCINLDAIKKENKNELPYDVYN
jgi:hypothetical protein